ncbi:c4f9d0e3-e0f9-4cc0-8917-d60b83ed44d1-CDS [Sclerotinia trifoliorum]|uniref:C4f9d0e3-e0f9-4cc0-8917-d60b83ed44d1-CDS n=1 Tax=Sclerotinia trifoliorum TaxID=28548 RepID=A0A8H2ZPH9_9HELO|nr:c4f9d0e3-e0f9-4cc0-8917-d60b83ed44d1-CDS [Sclerotinia trifoliorum]
MSKITPKNLSYNNTLPPFLQRLQANNSSANGRHEFTISRPSKLRDEDEEKESEPVVFDEKGRRLS